MGKATVTTHSGLTVKEQGYGGESIRYPGEAEGLNDSSAYMGAANEEVVREKSKGFDHRPHVLDTKRYLK